MLATPAVSQADQGRQRAAGHPAPTVVAGVSPATHLRRRDREAAWPPAEARSSEERGAPVRCAAPAQCYCARGETEPVTAPAGALCCPPDRPGPLRRGPGQRTSAVSRCVGATGRLQASLRPKVSLFPERSVHVVHVLPRLPLALQLHRRGFLERRGARRGAGRLLLLPAAFDHADRTQPQPTPWGEAVAFGPRLPLAAFLFLCCSCFRQHAATGAMPACRSGSSRR